MNKVYSQRRRRHHHRLREKSKTLLSSSSGCVFLSPIQTAPSCFSFREQRGGDDSLAADEAVTKFTLEISSEWLLLETYWLDV